MNNTPLKIGDRIRILPNVEYNAFSDRDSNSRIGKVYPIIKFYGNNTYKPIIAPCGDSYLTLNEVELVHYKPIIVVIKEKTDAN